MNRLLITLAVLGVMSAYGGMASTASAENPVWHRNPSEREPDNPFAVAFTLPVSMFDDEYDGPQVCVVTYKAPPAIGEDPPKKNAAGGNPGFVPNHKARTKWIDGCE